MSLTKKRTLTAKRMAANQENGRRSHGPATPQGRKRIREANTRHGFYSNKAEAVALACLGEDPDELARLRQNLHGDFAAPSAFEKELAEHLVQVVWRWRRAGHMQEGHALRRAKDANLTREDRLHAQMMRLKITAETLRRLAQSVAQEDYVTTPEDLEMMKKLHEEGGVKEVGEIILALLYRLRPPGADEDCVDPMENARLMVAQVKEIFGIGMTPPYAPQAKVAPNPSPAQGDRQEAGAVEAGVAPASSRPPGSQQHAGATLQGQQGAGATLGGRQVTGPAEAERDEPETLSPEEEAHERARQLLENILRRQMELCETQRRAILKESMEGPSPYERAAEIALAEPNTALMQRMEESSFRQIWRIATLLLKIKGQARKAEVRESPAKSRNVHEKSAA